MATGIRRHPALLTTAVLALLAALGIAAAPAVVGAADAPRRGGVLLAVIAAEPPSLDPHQEGTFANIQMVAPCYSTLLQFDPVNFQKIIGDLATEWKFSPDGLTYTFKIRQGVRFHDGSPLTSADVKASYDKIISPPPGVVAAERRTLAARIGNVAGRLPALPYESDAWEFSVRRHAPGVPGQDTRDVLLELGYASREVEALARKGIIRGPGLPAGSGKPGVGRPRRQGA